MSYSAHSRETIDEAWQNASPIPNTDAELWRQDEYGCWMHKPDFGNRHSQYGWELCENKGRCHGLQALQWQNYVDYCQAYEDGGSCGGTGSLF